MQDSRLNAMSVKRKFPVGLGKTRACGNCAISVGPHILINFRSLPVFGHKLLVLDCYLVCSSLKLRAATALTKKIVHASALTSRAQPASFPCSSPFFDSIFLFTFQFFNLYRFSFFFFLSVCLSLFTDVSLLSLSLSLPPPPPPPLTPSSSLSSCSSSSSSPGLPEGSCHPEASWQRNQSFGSKKTNDL